MSWISATRKASDSLVLPRKLLVPAESATQNAYTGTQLEKERAAFDEIEPDKARTRGIIAVSVVALASKAKAFRVAQDFAYAVFGEGRLPEFAVTDIRNLLQTIWTEEAIAAAGVKF